LLALRWLLRVGRLRPDDGLTVTPSHKEKPLAACRRTIVAGAKHSVLDDIAQRLELLEEAMPGAPLALWIRHQKLLVAWYSLAGRGDAVNHLPGARALDHIQGHDPSGLLAALGNEWAPGTNLLHVLQADDARAGDTGPL